MSSNKYYKENTTYTSAETKNKIYYYPSEIKEHKFKLYFKKRFEFLEKLINNKFKKK